MKEMKRGKEKEIGERRPFVRSFVRWLAGSSLGRHDDVG